MEKNQKIGKTKSMSKFLTPKHCMVVGEIAQSHDGSLGMAHAFIDAVARSGADAIKFQTHIAAAESTPQEPWRVKFSKQDASRYDYWKRMEFSPEQWQGLADHAKEKKLIFLSSPFSIEAVELLQKLDMPAWKVASGEVNNKQLLDAVLKTGKPILLSTGMSNLVEIDDAVDYVRKWDVEYAVMQCSTAYPCPPDKIGLNMIPQLRERYGCAVGLSDHSGTIYPGLAAVTMGIEVLELHVAFSREMFGPDVPASVTTAELAQLVEGVRFIEQMRNNPIDKNDFAKEVSPLRKLFMKSIVAGMDLPKGTLLEERHLRIKKPGSGIPGERLNELLGKQLLRDIKADEQILEGDFS